MLPILAYHITGSARTLHLRQTADDGNLEYTGIYVLVHEDLVREQLLQTYARLESLLWHAQMLHTHTGDIQAKCTMQMHQPYANAFTEMFNV